MSSEPTVFVVDDNRSVRKSLRELLRSAGLPVRTYASAEEFLDGFDPDCPGCLLLDVRLGAGRNGLELQDEFRRRKVALPIIVMTAYGDVPTSVRAMKSGAVDFLEKPVPPRKLIERIHEAIDIDRRAREMVAEQVAVNRRLGHLTPREREVMELLLEGKSSKEIAVALDLSVRTVEGHRRVIFRKMKVSSASHLVRAILLPRRRTPAAE